MKKTSIPEFKTDRDAAIFFDTHDSTDFISETVKTDISFPQPTHKILISLDEKDWRLLRRKASLSKIPYTHLLEKIIHTQLTT
ncbi:MAG: hypothetical protein HY591_02750 [Candidatus Omnitrophica bacterium]|nr:hypothetical protein [Candidatus Omnitrophota bacterium]